MNVSLRWLREFVDVPDDATPAELADALAGLGHEVEGYEILEPRFRGVVVGRVDGIAAHPNADKIRVCQVDTGEESLEIICGAWNFETGAVVPVAVPGSVLGEDFEITRREIRGVVSNGMICSAQELGLGEDHEGIMVLDDRLPIGADFANLVELPDVIFDLKITPNRPDAMSMWGLARDLAALWGIPVTIPEITLPAGGDAMAVDVTIEAPEGCRRFVGREIDGIALGASPLWMQLRLERAGVRAISNVVDVSNYVMLELGQPTHVFDRAKLAGERIVVRWAAEGETLVTLDGVERRLSTEDLVVADAVRPSALAGTMGGEDSEVSATTSDVFIEGASWDPPTVLRMSRRHNLRSEASARFERNVDPNLGLIAVNRVAQLILETAGGVLREGHADAHPHPAKPWTVTLHPRDVGRLLGVDIPVDVIRRALEGLDLETVGDDELIVTVPTNRPDLTRPADLIEEVARLYGFDNIPETLPSGHGGGLTPEQRNLRRLRWVMRAAGFHEAQTFSFHGHDELEMLALAEGDPRRNGIEVKNPLREEESLLRTTILVGLLRSLRYNIGHGIRNVGLFEIGRVFFNDDTPEQGVVPHQPVQLGFAAAGSLAPPAIDQPQRPVDAFDATAVWRLIVDQMGLRDAAVTQAEISGLHPGRGAEVSVGGSPVGFVGELHPVAARAFGLAGRVIVGELDVDQLVAPQGLWEFEEPSVFPPVEFDLSFDVGGLPAARVLHQAREAIGNRAESVRVFDEFVTDGQRSLAIRVTMRAADRTMTAEEMGAARRAVIQAVEREGASLRGG